MKYFLLLSIFLSLTAFADNLALNKTVTVSSVEKVGVESPLAVDGKPTTRWSSAYVDPSWIYIDLGAFYFIDRVVLIWQVAYGSAYEIQISNDATTWSTVYSTTTSDGLTDDISFSRVSTRYVRMYGTTRGTVYGYSLWEFEVYEAATPLETVIGEVACDTNTCMKYNQTMVYGRSDAVRTLSWSGQTPGTTLNVEILEFPPKIGQIASLKTTISAGVSEWKFIMNRAGAYWFRAQECNSSNVCGIWKDSLDPQYTSKTAYPTGFYLFTTLAPPSGGGIE